METNPYASPSTGEAQEARTDAGVWRDGDLLVVRRKRHILPDLCIICGAPSACRRWNMKVSWLDEKQRRFATAVFFLLGPWMFLFARSAAHSAILKAAFCGRHLWRRRCSFILRWASLPIAIAFCFYFAYHRIGDPPLWALTFLIGIASMLYGLYLGRLLDPALIDSRFVWLQGIPDEVLAQAPEIPHNDTDPGDSDGE